MQVKEGILTEDIYAPPETAVLLGSYAVRLVSTSLLTYIIMCAISAYLFRHSHAMEGVGHSTAHSLAVLVWFER